MSGDHVDDSKLTGMSKYFNGNTMRGRANVSIHYHMRTMIGTDCFVIVESLSIIIENPKNKPMKKSFGFT